MASPRVSVGLPVHNGQRYMREAIDSLLAQTFEDFELVISDNASTDATADISSDYARRDSRVRFVRSEVNRGLVWNFNNVFRLARGEYYKWLAHDDLCAPHFLRVCVDVLDRRRDFVLCVPMAVLIDARGQAYPLPRCRPHPMRVDSPRPHERFHDMLCCRGHGRLTMFGLIRSNVLARTAVLAPYVASDVALLAELALHGPFCEVPERLSLIREHPARHTLAVSWAQSRGGLFAPSLAGRPIFPSWRMLWELVGAVRRSGLDAGERRRCLMAVAAWAWRDKSHLRQDVGRFLYSLTIGRGKHLYGTAPGA
ncbi:MAG: glycosyltransferase family 2 protein [Phycisphaerae bacterium]